MIEVCCGSYKDGLRAYKGGATRIELNSALYLGGLTPSVASLRLLKRETKLTIICMVRPRGAGFTLVFPTSSLLMRMTHVFRTQFL